MAVHVDINPLDKQFSEAVRLPLEKRMYCNGFGVAISPADVALVLLFDNQPIGTINISHNVALGLRNVLTEVLSDFEKRTGHAVASVDQLNKAINDLPSEAAIAETSTT